MARNTTKYTPTEAIEQVEGLHRKKLYQMMKDGEISYEKQDKNRLLDASELIRVFGNDFQPKETQETFQGNTSKQKETPEKHTGNKVIHPDIHLLRERLADKDELIQDKNRQINDLRQDRNHWRDQAQTLLLSDQRGAVSSESTTETPLNKDEADHASPTVSSLWYVVVLLAVLLTLVMYHAQSDIYRIIDTFMGNAPETPPKQAENLVETPKETSTKQDEPIIWQQSFPPDIPR